MSHAYAMTTTIQALRDFAKGLFAFEVDATVGDLSPQPDIYPDLTAPVIRTRADGTRELARLRWGMPTPSPVLYQAAKRRATMLIRERGHRITPDEFAEMIKLEPDRGVHNVRNTDSRHWQRWLSPAFRVAVPFTSFAEFDNRTGAGGMKNGNTWFALEKTRPLGFFAGIAAPHWTSVRKVKDGPVTADLFGFLTSDANAEIAPVNPDAMPVILRSPAEVDYWLSRPWPEARDLQRPLPAGSLTIVSVGPKQDPPHQVNEPMLF